MDDSNVTIADLKNIVERFRADRNWDQHHTLKNLSISITIEAAELLENFQWAEDSLDQSALRRELADILIYCLFFAQSAQIDIARAVKEKLLLNEQKYPVDAFNSERNDLAHYRQLKLASRKQRS